MDSALQGWTPVGSGQPLGERGKGRGREREGEGVVGRGLQIASYPQ